MELVYRPLNDGELVSLSRQFTASYRAAYVGLMDENYLSSLKEDHWVPILRESLDRGDICLVAEEGNILLGAAVCGRAQGEDGLPYADFHAIYLVPEAIGRGVGHGLYTALERSVQERGLERIVLELLTENHRAAAFYRAHGYKKTAAFTVEENGMTLACDRMEKRLA